MTRIRFRRSGKHLGARPAYWAEWSFEDGYRVLRVNLPIVPGLLASHGWECESPETMDCECRVTQDAAHASEVDQLWWWNGNRTRPTLDPSISLKTGRPGSRDADLEVWHGHIIDGELRPCAGFLG